MVPLGIPHSVFLSWDEVDQDKALMFMAEKATVCNGCGTRKSEWEKDRYAYIADAEICPGCELLEMERANIPTEIKGARPFLIKNHPGLLTSDGFDPPAFGQPEFPRGALED